MNNGEIGIFGLFLETIKSNFEQVDSKEWRKVSLDGEKMFYINQRDPHFSMVGLYTAINGDKGPAILVLENYQEDLRFIGGLLSPHQIPCVRLEVLPRRTIPGIPGDLKYQACETVEYRQDGSMRIAGWKGFTFEYDLTQPDPQEHFLFTQDELRRKGLFQFEELPPSLNFVPTWVKFQQQFMEVDFSTPKLY